MKSFARELAHALDVLDVLDVVCGLSIPLHNRFRTITLSAVCDYRPRLVIMIANRDTLFSGNIEQPDHTMDKTSGEYRKKWLDAQARQLLCAVWTIPDLASSTQMKNVPTGTTLVGPRG